MKTMKFGKKKYRIDEGGFLLDRNQWTEDFAEGLAPTLKIPLLTEDHWKVIHFIRSYCKKEGRCPLVYETCRQNGLWIKDLKRLFPTGYQRGACKLAGITYKDSYPEFLMVPASESVRSDTAGAGAIEDKTYEVDVHGFLVHPDEWDERYAFIKSLEMGYPEGLSRRHWKIIQFLRDRFQATREVPTIFEVCEANKLELKDLEELFPHGYHRGAVKLAGLRIP